MLARGIPVSVVDPFPELDFLSHSVADQVDDGGFSATHNGTLLPLEIRLVPLLKLLNFNFDVVASGQKED